MSYYQLPENFQPGDSDVVIGKGKKYFFHSGMFAGAKLYTSLWNLNVGEHILKDL